MESEVFKELNTPKLNILKLLWIVLCFSTIVCPLIAYFVPGIISPQTNSLPNSVSKVFYILAGLLAIGSILIRRSLLSGTFIKKEMAKDIDAEKILTNNKKIPLKREDLDKFNSLSSFEQKLLALTNKAYVPNLITWILNESIAILGIVLAVLTGDASKLIPFAMLGICSNLGMFPNLDKVHKKARELM